jgi:hypothetical protein
LIFAAAAACAQVDANLPARLLQKYRSAPRAFDFGLMGDHPDGHAMMKLDQSRPARAATAPIVVRS